MSEIAKIEVRYDPNYPVFGMVGEPEPHEQHPNQQRGLDLYVRVINFDTGETCFKKLYRNARGLHFKHSGYSPMYLDDFKSHCSVIPFQVVFADEAKARRSKALDELGALDGELL